MHTSDMITVTGRIIIIRPLVIECSFPVHRPCPLKLAAWNVIIGSARINAHTQYAKKTRGTRLARATCNDMADMLLT